MIPIPPFLLSPTGLLGALTALLAALAASFFFLYRSEVASHADYKAKVLAAQEQIYEANRRARLEFDRVNRETADGWAAAVAVLRARPNPAIRVRSDCNPGGVSALSSTGLKPNGSAPEPGLDTSVSVTAEQCEKIANNAVQDAAQLIWLQHWIVQQSEVKQ